MNYYLRTHINSTSTSIIKANSLPNTNTNPDPTPHSKEKHTVYLSLTPAQTYHPLKRKIYLLSNTNPNPDPTPHSNLTGCDQKFCDDSDVFLTSKFGYCFVMLLSSLC